MSERVAALALSATPRADDATAGEAVVLDCDTDAIADLASNGNADSEDNEVMETADTKKPLVTNATIDYNDDARELVRKRQWTE